MKRLLAVAVLSLMALPAFAQDPTEAVQFFYNDPGSELAVENRDHFTDRAREILDAADAEANTDSGPCIEFMMSVDGQDFDEEELKKSLNLAGAMAGDYGSVEATFKQFGEDGKIEWTLEKVGGEWKIADIESPKNGWKLSTMPCAPMPAQ